MMMTQADLGQMLGIGQPAIKALIATRNVPHTAIINGIMYFCPDAIMEWAKSEPNLDTASCRVEAYRERLAAECPDAAAEILAFGKRFDDKKPPRRYYLIKIPNKKMGFAWYVKYLDNGRLVPSKWTTGTSDRVAAEAFAAENRDAILNGYYTRKAKRPTDMYRLISGYYDRDSPLLKADKKRGRKITDLKRRQYLNATNKKFIPFCKKNGARGIEDIDTAMLARWQNDMLKTLAPKTVNNNVSAVRAIFYHLVTTGYAKSNPFSGLPPIKNGKGRLTGCHMLDEIRGVFGRDWKDDAHRLLCLLIYTTNMRNCEIRRVRQGDVEEICGAAFLNVRGSKNESAERRVPLHPFVRQKMGEYAGLRDLVFSQGKKKFMKMCSLANIEMGELMGHTPETLKLENIRFYSGRKFWKTLMASEELGRNTEEYFMGHRMTSDMEKHYKDLTKVGAEKLAQKAREVFAVLDRCLFAV